MTMSTISLQNSDTETWRTECQGSGETATAKLRGGAIPCDVATCIQLAYKKT